MSDDKLNLYDLDPEEWHKFKWVPRYEVERDVSQGFTIEGEIKPLGDTEAQAFNEGFLAYGSGVAANPYEPDTREFRFYQSGWEVAAYQAGDTDRDGVDLIAEQRKRLMEQEALFPGHGGVFREKIVLAAVCYALKSVSPLPFREQLIAELWPWAKEEFKPGAGIYNLALAGALIAADLDQRLYEEEEE